MTNFASRSVSFMAPSRITDRRRRLALAGIARRDRHHGHAARLRRVRIWIVVSGVFFLLLAHLRRVEACGLVDPVWRHAERLVLARELRALVRRVGAAPGEIPGELDSDRV